MARSSWRGRTSTTPRSAGRNASHQGIIWNTSRSDNKRTPNSQLPILEIQPDFRSWELGVGSWEFPDSDAAAVRFHALQELRNRRPHPLRRLHEFHACPVGHDVLVDVADARMHDASLDDDRAPAKRQPQIMQGIEMEGKSGLDRGPADADFLDQHRLVHHDLADQITEDRNAIPIPLVRRHWRRIYH